MRRARVARAAAARRVRTAPRGAPESPARRPSQTGDFRLDTRTRSNEVLEFTQYKATKWAVEDREA